jgi:hypothetical protein
MQENLFERISIPALALLGQGFKKSPIGQKLDFANHPYLCKGLIKPLKRYPSFLDLILYFLGTHPLVFYMSVFHGIMDGKGRATDNSYIERF